MPFQTGEPSWDASMREALPLAVPPLTHTFHPLPASWLQNASAFTLADAADWDGGLSAKAAAHLE